MTLAPTRPVLPGRPRDVDGVDLRLALYSGIYVHHDAVSNSLLEKLRILEALRARGARLGLTVFTQASDYRDEYIRPVCSVMELLRRPEFWSADVHLFEFSMYYEVFNAVFVVPPGRPILVVEHNTTPPELVDIPEVKIGCELSMRQRQNLALADHVACDSEFNAELDRALGIEESRISVLHLPPAHRVSGPARAGFGLHEGPIELLYLGRFVRAKGIGDLLAAVEHLWGAGDDRFRLTLAGNPRFSDPAAMESIERALDRHERDGRLRLVASPTDDEIGRLFQTADALVIPSYHEGYCIPVVEALQAGCYVIGYDAANLPNVMGDLGAQVRTGDVEGLRDAVASFVEWLRPRSGSNEAVRVQVESGPIDFATWSAAVGRHLASYTGAAYERRFLDLLGQLAATSPAGWSPRLARIVDERLAEIAILDDPGTDR